MMVPPASSLTPPRTAHDLHPAGAAARAEQLGNSAFGAPWSRGIK